MSGPRNAGRLGNAVAAAGRRPGRVLPVAALLAVVAGVSVSRSEVPTPQVIRPDIISVRVSPRILTRDLAAQIEPAISGTRVVFTDFRNGQADIYLWDLGVEPNLETRLTNGIQDERSPDIFGTTVVYVDLGPDTGGGDIYALGIIGGGRTPVAVESRSRQGRPAIRGTLVAWEDDRDGNPEIYARDLATGVTRRLTNTPEYAEMEPAVDRGRVVYSRRAPNGTCQIVLTDFATLESRTLTDAATCFRRPDIERNFVVYDGTPDRTQDIFVHDLRTGTETRVVLAGIQRDAHISGPWLSAEKVAMVPIQNSNMKIYNIPEQIPLEPVTAETNEFDGDISGRIVVYTTDARGNFDIAVYGFTPIGLDTVPVADAGPDITVGCATAAGAPVTLDGTFSGNSEGDPMTYRWTGPFTDGSGEAGGPTPTVGLPIGTSTVSLVVSDGTSESAPDTVAVQVQVEARGLQPVLDGLETAAAAGRSGERVFKAGSMLPLRLSLACAGTALRGGDVAPPRLLSPGPGGPFTATGDVWHHNLSTRGLQPGSHTVTIELPDGRVMNLPITIR